MSGGVPSSATRSLHRIRSRPGRIRDRRSPGVGRVIQLVIVSFCRAMNDRVVIVSHDPTWSGRAAELAARLAALLGSSALRIEHVGSTAIIGMPAKDVLDLQVSVRDLAEA